MSLLKALIKNKEKGLKSFAVLLDPDKLCEKSTEQIIKLSQDNTIDYFFVGGSLITNDSFNCLIEKIKSQSDIPIIIFPGSNLQISPQADALLLLSLISGRNPEFLIGQHVIAAPALKKSGLEIISTGYLLVDCGKPTTVSYISNTTPIPHDKPSVAVCTAMAGEMLGMQAIYLDGGSGALNPISADMIGQVKASINTPLIVGGGINTIEKARKSLGAGADVLVVGNAIEEKSDFLAEVAELIKEFNRKL
jgi:geranylgeranylglyceryl phosphate synthase family protein